MDKLNKILLTPLSPEALKQLGESFGLDLDVVMYDQIIGMSNIDQLLGNTKDGVIIFYPNEKDGNILNGHFVCMFKKGSTIYFYDSYSDKPDTVKLQTLQRDELYRENINSLINLLVESPYQVDYNHFKHQKLSNNSSTCGRWSIFRLIHNDLNTQEFDKEVKRLTKMFGLDGDQLVSVAIH